MTAAELQAAGLSLRESNGLRQRLVPGGLRT